MYMNEKCCDKCKYYQWYWDYCTKYHIHMNYRSVQSCFEPRVDNNEKKEKDDEF
jgi:hypothetical protein